MLKFRSVCAESAELLKNVVLYVMLAARKSAFVVPAYSFLAAHCFPQSSSGMKCHAHR